jgi:hypothetical protein
MSNRNTENRIENKMQRNIRSTTTKEKGKKNYLHVTYLLLIGGE